MPVEPATNYLVSRMAKEYGSSRIGFLLESVNRNVPQQLSFLRRDAYVLGVDGYTKFHKNAWLLEWQAGMTRIDGTAEAIADTQTSPAHYYNRPDADYLHYDPTRTSLDGFGGRVMLGKQTGHWLPNFQIQTYSPGFEINDIGYEQRVDITATHAALYYDNQDVTARTRERSWWVGKYQNWNYGGDLIENRAETEPYGDFRLHRDLAAIRHAPSQDVFLIKVSTGCRCEGRYPLPVIRYPSLASRVTDNG